MENANFIKDNELKADMAFYNALISELRDRCIKELSCKYPFDGIDFTFVKPIGMDNFFGVNINLDKIKVEQSYDITD